MTNISAIFAGSPSVAFLHWLVQGNLASSMSRAIRFWVILGLIYGDDPDRLLPDVFRYPDLRDRLFASSHPTSDKLKAEHFLEGCGNPLCICDRSIGDWLLKEWNSEVQVLTGFSAERLEVERSQLPFATVHRSIRADLEKLAQLGWLKSGTGGEFRRLATELLPQMPLTLIESSSVMHPSVFDALTPRQGLDLLVALETLSMVQPNLELLIEPLSVKILADANRDRLKDGQGDNLAQRTFVHFDYILSDAVQDRVDDYHQQLEDLWHTHDAGVVQFKYEMVRRSQASGAMDSRLRAVTVLITAYPVCIHYLRRAKYLSAYGVDPDGKFGWHNYRLDRVVSPDLTVLAWGDRAVPRELRELRNGGNLPTSQQVEAELQKAWGFRFYDEPQLLLMRFDADFARWYVDQTVRHPTFKPIAFAKIPLLLERAIASVAEREKILAILSGCDEGDRYFQVWIRADDINIVQRLRDWRPNGEVLAPLSLRRRMVDEATLELRNYLSV